MRFNMNTKLMFGLAMASSASLFWACGEGDILEMQNEDSYVVWDLEADTNGSVLRGLIREALNVACGDSVVGPDGQVQVVVNQQCVDEAQPGQLDDPTLSSSSAAPVTNPYATSSSGTFNPFGGNQQQTPTSSGNVTVVSSPSQMTPTSSPNPSNPTSQATASSSSAIPVDPNAWGTCAAATTTNSIKKGASVQWKVSFDNTTVSPSIMTSGSFSWTFQDGTPATATVQKSVSSPSVSYSTSGEKGASVVVSFNGQTNTIQCTPLNVTGAEVSGCKCTPSATQVDVAAQQPVTWTVAGCTSTETTFSYVWSDGLVGTTSAAGTLGAKGTYAPTVTVKNADNGMMTVQCGAVTAIDSNNPDYVIKATGTAGQIDLPAGKVTVMVEVQSAYNNKVVCNAQGQISGTVNGVALNAPYYATAEMPAGTIKKGAQLVFELASPAKCGVE